MIRKHLSLLFLHWHHVTLIFRNYRRLPDRLAVLSTYARINLRYVVQVRILKRHLEHEKFLGFDVTLADYLSFRDLFDELFVMREYDVMDEPEPHIIDCGSNIGMSVLFFKRMFPLCSVLCFEPNPAVFRCLEQNVANNRLDRVELIEAAVALDVGSATLYSADSIEGGDLEVSLVSTMQRAVPLTESAVRCVRLSDHIDRPVHLLKLDIQGAEGEVVEELASSGKLGLVQRIIIEYHDDQITESNRLGRLLKRLEDAGFRFVIHSVQPPPYARYAGKPALLQIYSYRSAARSI
jgi:FkbM family methyltransferase